MTEDTARRLIDWLHSTPVPRACPTPAGEPLLRPDFIHKVIYYAAKKDFWVYLATNARLLRPEVTEPTFADARHLRLINFAVEVTQEKPGLPKAFEHVRSDFTATISSGGNTVMAIPCFSTPTSPNVSMTRERTGHHCPR